MCVDAVRAVNWPVSSIRLVDEAFASPGWQSPPAQRRSVLHVHHMHAKHAEAWCMNPYRCSLVLKDGSLLVEQVVYSLASFTCVRSFEFAHRRLIAFSLLRQLCCHALAGFYSCYAAKCCQSPILLLRCLCVCAMAVLC